MNDAYVQGFMDKCAEAGVDSEALIKAARIKNRLAMLYTKLMTPSADKVVKRLSRKAPKVTDKPFFELPKRSPKTKSELKELFRKFEEELGPIAKGQKK